MLNYLNCAAIIGLKSYTKHRTLNVVSHACPKKIGN